MNRVTAVLLDTVSIQKYIFAGNMLRENLGASALVRSIYGKPLQDALEQTTGMGYNIEAWKKDPDRVLIKDDPSIPAEIGYVGGGNALLFFGGPDSADRARAFVRNWTERLLETAPGLSTAVGLKEDFDFADIKGQMKQLHQNLAANKNKYFPVTTFVKHGITRDCPRSGGAAETVVRTWKPDGGVETEYVSWEFKAKLEKEENDVSWDWLLPGELADRFCFTNELGELGQVEGESHIAVIHIDGNLMSQVFESCATLEEKRRLSLAVNDTAEEAFAAALQEIWADGGIHDLIFGENSVFRIKPDTRGRKKLPVRPIILEGDDMTFVTEARLGLYLAEKVIACFTTRGKENLRARNLSGKVLSASGGVAIVKTKYPFYRAYTLAEELCANAKKRARFSPDTSWLDFYIAYGSFSGELERIRKKHYYIDGLGLLYFGPYQVGGNPDDEAHCMDNLRRGIAEFSKPDKWPRSKAKKIRELLFAGPDAVREYMADTGISLPVVRGKYNYHTIDAAGWGPAGAPHQAASYKATPYLDMLDLTDFYPPELLGKWGDGK
ncbi:Cas10/Cmr2 second palm domain-containing protein [Thermincola ferriacetica]